MKFDTGSGYRYVTLVGDAERMKGSGGVKFLSDNLKILFCDK